VNVRFSRAEGQLWVELGPTFVPSADIARNVCCPRTHRSQIGQYLPVGIAVEFSSNRPLTLATWLAHNREGHDDDGPVPDRQFTLALLLVVSAFIMFA
jgi:hypothetical protein